MNKEKIIKKITSRKFIVSIITLISGIALLFGADGDTVETLSAAAMILVPTLVYCITEGRLDESALKNFGDALNILEKSVKNEDMALKILLNILYVFKKTNKYLYEV